MDSQYPVQPYKPVTETTTVVNGSLTGKRGKIIDYSHNNGNPEIVTFTIKSNRGTTKDVIEIPIDQVLDFSRWITGWYAYMTNKV